MPSPARTLSSALRDRESVGECGDDVGLILGVGAAVRLRLLGSVGSFGVESFDLSKPKPKLSFLSLCISSLPSSPRISFSHHVAAFSLLLWPSQSPRPQFASVTFSFLQFPSHRRASDRSLPAFLFNFLRVERKTIVAMASPGGDDGRPLMRRVVCGGEWVIGWMSGGGWFQWFDVEVWWLEVMQHGVLGFDGLVVDFECGRWCDVVLGSVRWWLMV
ncbi:hypothetical protein Droror1_Dr00001844 [Drosera rotundifolia]